MKAPHIILLVLTILLAACSSSVAATTPTATASTVATVTSTQTATPTIIPTQVTPATSKVPVPTETPSETTWYDYYRGTVGAPNPEPGSPFIGWFQRVPPTRHLVYISQVFASGDTYSGRTVPFTLTRESEIVFVEYGDGGGIKAVLFDGSTLCIWDEEWRNLKENLHLPWVDSDMPDAEICIAP